MCWESNKLKIKTAKKNIPVYKIVRIKDDNKIYSYYIPFIYELGVTYKGDMKFEISGVNGRIYGTNGFHSYSCKTHYKEQDETIVIFKKKPFSTYTIDTYCRSRRVLLAYCHIPKGAKYVINKNGKMMSSEIVIDKVS